MARTSKLTVRMQDKICAALCGGMSNDGACAFAGIDRATFYRWIDLGKRGRRSKRYQAFHKAVEEAKSNLEGRITTKILKAIDEGKIELGLPFLERRFPERWGKRDNLNVSGNVQHDVPAGVKIVPSPTCLPEEEDDPTAIPKKAARGKSTKKHDRDPGDASEQRR